jgi:inner membrane protein
VAVAAVAAFFRGPASFGRRLRIGLLLFVVTASHGVLDSMTDGGRGIAFLAPFTSKRFFSPWQPLHVSPLDLGGFFGRGGFEALRTEAIWIWLPAAGLVAGAALARRARRTDPRGGAAAGGPP